MNELPAFFRANTEKVTYQCSKHLEEAGLLHPGNKKRYLAAAADLVDALAGSIEAKDPGIFKERLEPYLKNVAGRKALPGLPHILASVERAAMELEPDEVQAKFLWPLFHQARIMTMNIRGGAEGPRSNFEGPTEETLAALKNDIADRKRMEEELRESERKFRDIAELSPQVIFELTHDGSVSFVNKQGLELFGYTWGDIEKGLSTFALFPEFEHPTLRENMEKIIAGERGTTGYEYTVQKKGGATFNAIIYTTAIFKDGRHSGFRGVLVDITPLKRTEEVLRESEKKFRDLAELMPQIIFEIDETGTITFANKQALEIFGYNERELSAGINAFSLFPTEELPRLMANLQKITEGGRSPGNEYRVLKKDGSSFPVIIHVARIMREGRLTGYRGIIIDITEQKSAQQNIEESEKMYRTFFDSTTDFVFLKDEKLHYILVNKAFIEFFGKKEREILGMTDFALMPHEAASNCHQTDLKTLEASAITVSREAIGEKIYETLKFPVEIAKGKFGIGGFIRDITERTRAEEELKAKTEELDRYFSNALDLFCIADTDGYFRRLNRAWETTLGYPLGELEGHRFLDFVHPDDLEITNQAVSRLSRQQEVLNFTNRYQCRDGSYRYIEWKSYPVEKQIFAAARDITDRKLAEKALMQSEQRLRQIIDLVPHFIFAKDIGGRFILANKATADIYGTTVENLIGRLDARFTQSDEEVKRFRDDDTEVISKDIAKSILEETITDSRGEKHYLHTIKIPFTFSGTDTPSVLGVSVDITENKRALEALSKSEERLRKYFEVPLVGVTIVAPDGKWLEVNDRFCRMVGYSREELLQMDWQCLTPSEDLTEEIGNYNAFLAGKKEIMGTREKRYRKKDGTFIDVILSTHCVRKEDGSPDYFTAVIQEITERKAFERKIIESEQALRATLAASPIGIGRVRGRAFEWVNEAMCGITGYSVDELAGNPVRFLYETDEEFGRVGEHLYRDDQTQTKWVRKDGEIRHILLQISPTDNNAHIVTASDITDRKHLEAQLMHSQKMEAVGTLAGGVAHDFNNLLSAIMGYASLLQIKMDRGDPLHTYVSQILLSSEKAANLTQSLLAFSRKQVINLKPIALNDTVEKLHRLLHRLIPEDVEFRIDSTPERLVVPGDSGQIDQVIMNLVTNARDSMPHGGKITIRIDRALIDNGFIAAHGYGKPGEYALITVSDTGYGMDEKTAEKIFEPFFTTKEVGKGTGLGLAIVYGIVKQHNGYIEVKSQPGKGSTFSIYLPLVWLEPVDETIREEIVGGSETILVAEDNNELRALSVNVLEDNGYKVIAAGDGAEAVDAFSLQQGDISIVILDVVMPKMNGKEVFEAIKKLDPTVKVIFTSGYTDDIIEEKGMVNEKYDFLGKPITPGTLLKKIREVLDRE